MLLKNPDEKIPTIAFDTGFKSKSTFNAAFAKFADMSPSEFRKKNQTIRLKVITSVDFNTSDSKMVLH